jgi:hypothetical protein
MPPLDAHTETLERASGGGKISLRESGEKGKGKNEWDEPFHDTTSRNCPLGCN